MKRRKIISHLHFLIRNPERRAERPSPHSHGSWELEFLRRARQDGGQTQKQKKSEGTRKVYPGVGYVEGLWRSLISAAGLGPPVRDIFKNYSVNSISGYGAHPYSLSQTPDTLLAPLETNSANVN